MPKTPSAELASCNALANTTKIGRSVFCSAFGLKPSAASHTRAASIAPSEKGPPGWLRALSTTPLLINNKIP